MSKKKEHTGINWNRTVGLLLIAVAAYFIILFLQSEKKPHINFYEVETGSLVREHNYEGLILRNEKTVASEGNGYVNFYIPDTRKASMGQRIYSIDESGNLKAYLSAHSDELSSVNSEKLASLRSEIIRESRDFSGVNYRSSYMLKDSLDAAVLEFSDIDVLSQISDQLRASGLNLNEYHTDTTGIISYNIDGFEEKTAPELTAASFDKSQYQKTRLKSGDLVVEGDPVYKIITDEKWEIVFPMTEEDVTEFEEKNSLLLSFKEKGIRTSADFSVMKGADAKDYGILSLSRYVVQFVSDRFIDFEIVTNDVSGLKIPDKSVTSKDFYIIPDIYKASDEKGNQGFYKDDSEEITICDIFYDDGEYSYISADDSSPLQRGDFVTDRETGTGKYEVKSVRPLTGVYNINKGYTVFKRIEVLETANGYCIIKKNTGHGLSVYDHIVLDASSVTEGQVLY